MRRTSDPFSTSSKISLEAIRRFLAETEATSSDLVVVPHIFQREIARRTTAKVMSVGSHLDERWKSLNPAPFLRLLWATERVDAKSKIARDFYAKKKEVVSLRHAGPAKIFMHDPVKEKVLTVEWVRQKREKVDKFSYGPGADFVNLMQAVDWARLIPGDFVEIGCFNGSSTNVLVTYMEQTSLNKQLYVYDTFTGFDYVEAAESIDSSWVGTHRSIGQNRVQQNLAKRASSIPLPKVISRNILQPEGIQEVDTLAFASIDVDIYEAVGRALDLVDNKIVKGGIILVEDPGHTPRLLGAKVALDEWLDSFPSDRYLKFFLESGQYLLVRQN